MSTLSTFYSFRLNSGWIIGLKNEFWLLNIKFKYTHFFPYIKDYMEICVFWDFPPPTKCQKSRKIVEFRLGIFDTVKYIFAFVIKMPTLYRIGCFRDGNYLITSFEISFLIQTANLKHYSSFSHLESEINHYACIHYKAFIH